MRLPCTGMHLACGALQMASVVVTQSHLTDIDHSLKALKDGVNTILDNLESAFALQLVP